MFLFSIFLKKRINLFLILSLCLNGNLLFSQDTPNVLFIVADDLGLDALHSSDYGITLPSQPTTPHITSLRDNGISFLNTWATPQCTTTRASVMSGKYGINTGVRNVPGHLSTVHESIFNYMNNNQMDDYAKAVIGKWHISQPIDVNHPYAHGVDHYEGVIAGTISDYYSWSKVDENGQTSQINEYVTQHFTNSAIDWISDQTDPWFLWLAHIAPHGPFHTPPAGTFSQNNLSNNRRRYIAMIESLDYYIGELLDSMDQETRDNTLIIFIGDNGSPNMVARYFPNGHVKGSMYEGGLRVPMIFSGSGVTRQGELENGLVQVNDIYATLIELLSNDLEGGIHNSYSIADALTTQNTITRPYIYADYIDNGIEYWAIRNDTYKLIENENGDTEFYNVVTDLEELTDLVGNLTIAQTSIFNELQAEAAIIRSDWSCNDQILNGDEVAIDDCANCSAQTTFTMSGWDNGVPDASVSATIAADYDTASLGSIAACELIVNSNVTLTVGDDSYIQTANNIRVDGMLTIANSGSVVQTNNAAITVNNGTIELQKTTPPLNPRDFILLSSPMSNEERAGVHSSANRVFGIISENFSPDTDPALAGVVANYIDNDNNHLNNAITNLAIGESYLIFPQAVSNVGAVTYTHVYSQGTLNSGVITKNITYNGPSTANNPNFIGNPYPSSIDINMFITANPPVNEVHFWQHITTPNENLPGSGNVNFSMDDVSLRNLIGGIAAVNGGSAPGQFVTSGQGFAFMADQAASGTNVTFTPDMQVNHDNGTPRNSIQDDKLWLRLDSETYTVRSMMAIGFVPEASPGFDSGYDSNRMDTTISLFSTLEGGEQLSIQGREAFDPNMEITVGFSNKIPETENYTISIDQLEGEGLTENCIFLIDHFLDTMTDLKVSDYTFASSETVQSNRFTLTFTEPVLGINTIDPAHEINLYPNPLRDKVTITYSGMESLQELVIYDISGRVVRKVDLSDFEQQHVLDVSDLQSGLYVFSIGNDQSTQNFEVVKK